MANGPKSVARASAPIPLQDALRALLLLGAAQVGAFLLFIMYSAVIFRLWEGGILFYKSIVAAALFSLLLFWGLLWAATNPTIDCWLSLVSLHRLWFATLSATAQFCIIVLFIGLGPVSIDRSVSVYLLGTINSEREHAFSVSELEDLMTKNYVHRYGAVGRRLAEQVASRNIESDKDGGYRLTEQGAVVVRAMEAIGWIFNIDRRFIDPPEFDSAQTKNDRLPSTLR